MALSNIFREPVREIREMIVGALIIAPFLIGDYFLALEVQVAVPDMPLAIALAVSTFAIMIGITLIIVVIYFIHDLGEGVCDMLEVRGFRLRPRR